MEKKENYYHRSLFIPLIVFGKENRNFRAMPLFMSGYYFNKCTENAE